MTTPAEISRDSMLALGTAIEVITDATSQLMGNNGLANNMGDGTDSQSGLSSLAAANLAKHLTAQQPLVAR